MKEINNYGITNPDGNSPPCSNLGKTRYANDDPRQIKESSSMGQQESFSSSETFDDRKKQGSSRTSSRDTGKSNNSGNSSGGNSSASSSSSASSASSASSVSSSAASGAASTAAASSAAVGSSVGAIAGMVTSAVATAAIVVAVFVSTLSINLSLVMANVDSLVLQIEMQGAQDEDFENPIWAILTSDDGFYQEQEVYKDTVLLNFSDLQPGKEYLIRIKNSEKVFVEKTFFTATEKIDRGKISTRNEGNLILGVVENVQLRSGEFYTVTAKDGNGNVLFSKDSIDKNLEFSFTVDKPTNLLFSLSVNGIVYAVSEVEMVFPENKPRYDFDSYEWTWTDHVASISFASLSGGDPLVINATVNLVSSQAPTCEEIGLDVYSASVTYNDREYTDSKEFVTGEKLGHNYTDPYFVWTETSDGYAAALRFVCANDENHFVDYAATIFAETIAPECGVDGRITYYASVENEELGEEPYYDEKTVVLEGSALEHEYGELISERPATSTVEGFAAHYVCSNCKKYFNADYQEVLESDLIIACYQLEYDYSEPIWDWEMDNDVPTGNVTVTFAEVHDDEPLVIPIEAEFHLLSMADCESPEIYCYYANTSTLELPGVDEIYYSESSSFEVGEPLGHEYGEYISETAYYTCSVCGYENEDRKEEYEEAQQGGQGQGGNSGSTEGTELSLSDGAIYIDSTGYARSHNGQTLTNATSCTNSENNPYIIGGSITGDESLDIYNMSGTKQTFYLIFEDGFYIKSGRWATAFRIVANADIEIHIVNRGTATIIGGNHPAIELQGSGASPTADIYVESEGGFDTFKCSQQGGAQSDKFGASNGSTVNFYMNGQKQ